MGQGGGSCGWGQGVSVYFFTPPHRPGGVLAAGWLTDGCLCSGFSYLYLGTAGLQVLPVLPGCSTPQKKNQLETGWHHITPCS